VLHRHLQFSTHFVISDVPEASPAPGVASAAESEERKREETADPTMASASCVFSISKCMPAHGVSGGPEILSAATSV
jgi:hypothetical protein